MASNHRPSEAVLDAARPLIDRPAWEPPLVDYLRSWGMSEDQVAGIIKRCQKDPALRAAFLAAEKTP